MINIKDLTIIETTDDFTSHIEYKGIVIQIYAHEDRVCFFVMKEDGNDDKEFFNIIEAFKYVNKVTK